MFVFRCTRSKPLVLIPLLLISLAGSGCRHLPLEWTPAATPPPEKVVEPCPTEPSVTEAQQANVFREAETRRAEQLTREIERLQADLRTAEGALVEAESGLAGSHTRAETVSMVAVTRIKVERAAERAPWRSVEIDSARDKLAQAERQVENDRFGAALFFVYRARRVAESVLDEADQVIESARARLIRATRVNLRAGPSTQDPILAVLDQGTPVIPQLDQGSWTLIQVTGGPSGWVHRSLLGRPVTEAFGAPAAPAP